jgi:transcriptional regulator with XRE-family HTH domain
MKFSDAFREIIKSRGYTQQSLAEKVGVKQSSIGSMLAKGNPSVNAMVRYLSEAGYDVALVPTGSNLPDGSYVMEPNDAQ